MKPSDSVMTVRVVVKNPDKNFWSLKVLPNTNFSAKNLFLQPHSCNLALWCLAILTKNYSGVWCSDGLCMLSPRGSNPVCSVKSWREMSFLCISSRDYSYLQIT